MQLNGKLLWDEKSLGVVSQICHELVAHYCETWREGVRDLYFRQWGKPSALLLNMLIVRCPNVHLYAFTERISLWLFQVNTDSLGGAWVIHWDILDS